MQDQTLKERIKEAFTRNNADLAYDLIKEIDTLNPDTKQAQTLERLKAQLAIVALRYRSDDRIEELFENHAGKIMFIPEDIDLVNNIRYRLTTELDINDRNKLRDRLISALQRSSDTIGSQNLQLGTEVVSPSVSNWIRLYISEVGSDSTSKVKQAQFFTQNNSVEKLNENEKRALRNLITVYEYLKLRSDSLEGFEDVEYIDDDDTGNIMIFGEGRASVVYDERMIRKLKDRAAKGELSISQLADLQIRFPEEFEQFKIVNANTAEQPEPVYTENLNSPENIQDFFTSQAQKYGRVQMVEPVDQQSSTLIARSLSQMLDTTEHDKDQVNQIKQKLLQIIKDKDLFSEFVKESRVQDLLLENLDKVVDPKDANVIKQSPASPIAFQALLRIIFENKLGLSPEESAWHSFDLVQHFPVTLPEFKTLVAYDVSNNKLTWRYE